ncbi:MAG: tRNA 2-thiouridine(34) synthase MnmA [Acidobacteria bacterium]|nr:tRNA 2-thiouridine(34) synthase MnmA [Holophagales bacterium]MYH24500.1 tRNA 2-thiouridine(34) synthase MnmA [Holophagales bacterium]MYK89673.1 tRNA 2-thiouridine(34) synthase MnmA [Acidobacteriota bacterium]
MTPGFAAETLHAPALPGAAPATLTAVAMSGGLDSSVAALLLEREGVPVVGLSMLLWDRSQQVRHGRCCGSLDLGDARRVAEQIGLPHYTLRMDGEFRRHVVDPFVDSYVGGRTPSPCISCNTEIKFEAFRERARRLGAGRIATGHYARIRRGDDGLYELHTAVDTSKDQSYFLFELTQEQLSRAVFPLGELTKTEVRELAREAGLAVAEKGESMEICFVDRGVREFVEDERPELPRVPARVTTTAGEVLGEGAPTYRYTVGQRRGLGVAAGRRLYVLDVQPEANRVVVGDRDELLAPGLVGRGLHWIAGEAPGDGVEVQVRIRSRHPGVAATVESGGGASCRVEFSEPQAGVAPGQAAVFYRGTQVLGGCWIEGPLR